MFLGGNKPSRTADLRGDISVNFSCDPEISSKLVRSFFPHDPINAFSVSFRCLEVTSLSFRLI